MDRRLLLLPALVTTLALSACGSSDDNAATSAATGASSATADSATTAASSADPIAVVATTTQLGDIVRQIGGDAADVTQILQPNSDPHDYEPRPQDVTETAGAKVVFESGDNLDHWMADVVTQSGGDPTVVTLADSAVDRVPGETSGPEASRYDPHWWHDPANVEAAIPVIRDALSSADPAARATYDANAAAYLAKVQALDAGIRKCFAAVPAAQRKLVTDHDAFNYFAKRYDVQVIGAVIPSQTTQAQASAGDVARLVQTIRAEGVRAVFPESSVNPKLARAIAQESGASADHTLYGDTLGPQDSPGATYLTMEQANADAMLRGFTGGRRGCTIAGI
ncbi:metal ABC transporter substrate-binding protein [Conexibacter sp. CPCC 206217]|uniref:metal ABC transporter substrate-binding protein n=1 Tax=Conexibacter sp. CPCC 206217 TaxID=3064574 RepID=UPI00271A0F13|nr:metal ABC transporter substrate-binding protein [Conexibacter sp. CPCC 206217]MDO8212516.1 metal ABC transporter substrate-binding protein [Conexibacter sp. CPCC 206217]